MSDGYSGSGGSGKKTRVVSREEDVSSCDDDVELEAGEERVKWSMLAPTSDIASLRAYKEQHGFKSKGRNKAEFFAKLAHEREDRKLQAELGFRADGTTSLLREMVKLQRENAELRRSVEPPDGDASVGAGASKKKTVMSDAVRRLADSRVDERMPPPPSRVATDAYVAPTRKPTASVADKSKHRALNPSLMSFHTARSSRGGSS